MLNSLYWIYKSCHWMLIFLIEYQFFYWKKDYSVFIFLWLNFATFGLPYTNFVSSTLGMYLEKALDWHNFKLFPTFPDDTWVVRQLLRQLVIQHFWYSPSSSVSLGENQACTKSNFIKFQNFIYRTICKILPRTIIF